MTVRAMQKTTGHNPDKREWVVYALKCPETGAVRYVGWTFNLKNRLSQHKSTARKFKRHRDMWIRSLMNEGKFPAHQIIESGNGDWSEAEKKWISHYRSIGSPLTNLTDGGEGVVGLKLSREVIERIRQKKIGKKQPPEVVARRAASLIGHSVSDETRRKISLANRGKVRTELQRQRLSQSLKGRNGTPVSEEAKAKISAAARRRYQERPESFKPTRKDLTGGKFGRLTAIRCVGLAANNECLWECACECGGTKVTKAYSLNSGATRSCGCLANEARALRSGPMTESIRRKSADVMDAHRMIEQRQYTR